MEHSSLFINILIEQFNQQERSFINQLLPIAAAPRKVSVRDVRDTKTMSMGTRTAAVAAVAYRRPQPLSNSGIRLDAME